MQQLATAMIAAASPRNANIGNRAFIATAGLTPWAAIIKPKVWGPEGNSSRPEVRLS